MVRRVKEVGGCSWRSRAHRSGHVVDDGQPYTEPSPGRRVSLDPEVVCSLRAARRRFATVMMELRQRHGSGDAGGTRPASVGPGSCWNPSRLDTWKLRHSRVTARRCLLSTLAFARRHVDHGCVIGVPRKDHPVGMSTALLVYAFLTERTRRVPASEEVGLPWSPRRRARAWRVTRERIRSCVRSGSGRTGPQLPRKRVAEWVSVETEPPVEPSAYWRACEMLAEAKLTASGRGL